MFYSSEPTGRLEPADFVAHLLTRWGLTPPELGLRDTVVLSFLPELERRLLKSLDHPPPHPQQIQRQTWYNPEHQAFSIMGTPMGAPMAVMLLEQLIAIGARRFLYLGFCGALDPSYHIGDCFMPTTGRREEGTSYHYLPADITPAASTAVNRVIQTQATSQGLPLRSGPIWTTDAPYRETDEKIVRFQSEGICAVDMEMAALFAVAQYRACEVSAIHVVSDECYHPTWKPGFDHSRLRHACQQAVDLCLATAGELAAESVEQA